MFVLERNKVEKKKCIANILPCRINHNGPVSASRRYWNPIERSDGLSVAYFRGKKLHGKRLHLPKGNRGVVVTKTDRKMDCKKAEKTSTPIPEGEIDVDHEEDQEDKQLDVTILEEKFEFENIMIWGHESQPDPITDPYTRGILEWIDFSTLIHSYE
ncbi:putative rna exonuclease 4 [Golovinomyces cichoracearum]|uniref:Putative rna exonuclease 4 n=1 Tax=Golovinomyces cichoracearum TaxID=62708 RepID=A0A420IE55_9PEZI|nr:putative rna exonuclease 4 [Golovinomyces cichoracearum]